MHQAILADIQETASRPAVPIGRDSAADVLLEAVEVGERKEQCLQSAEPVVDALMLRGERLQSAGVIVQDADRAGEGKLAGSLANRERILGVSNAGAQYGVDGYAELGVRGEPFQLAVEHL